jgi:hypothetical protein
MALSESEDRQRSVLTGRYAEPGRNKRAGRGGGQKGSSSKPPSSSHSSESPPLTIGCRRHGQMCLRANPACCKRGWWRAPCASRPGRRRCRAPLVAPSQEYTSKAYVGRAGRGGGRTGLLILALLPALLLLPLLLLLLLAVLLAVLLAAPHDKPGCSPRSCRGRPRHGAHHIYILHSHTERNDGL